MTDEELVVAFESVELPAGAFDHTAHVRVGWWYLTHFPFGDALARFSVALRRFAEANGASGKYHETITVAYMALIAERIETAPGLAWPAFIERHPELLAQPSILASYYARETLASDRARRIFVLPDRSSS